MHLKESHPRFRGHPQTGAGTPGSGSVPDSLQLLGLRGKSRAGRPPSTGAVAGGSPAPSLRVSHAVLPRVSPNTVPSLAVQQALVEVAREATRAGDRKKDAEPLPWGPAQGCVGSRLPSLTAREVVCAGTDPREGLRSRRRASPLLLALVSRGSQVSGPAQLSGWRDPAVAVPGTRTPDTAWGLAGAGAFCGLSLQRPFLLPVASLSLPFCDLGGVPAPLSVERGPGESGDGPLGAQLPGDRRPASLVPGGGS